jgi:hypothetical protein
MKSHKEQQYRLEDSKISDQYITMPIEVSFSPMEFALTHKGRGDSTRFIFKEQEPEKWRPLQEWINGIDTQSVVDALPTVNTPGAARRFLSITGPFHTLPDDTIARELAYKDFRLWQHVVRRIASEGFPPLGLQDEPLSQPIPFLQGEPPELRSLLWNVSHDTFMWLQGFPSHINIYSPRKPRNSKVERPSLRAYIHTATTLDAILATIYLKKLQGITYRLCARTDCKQIFEDTRPDRRFCSQYCGNLTSKRRMRQEAREIRNAPRPSSAAETKLSRELKPQPTASVRRGKTKGLASHS